MSARNRADPIASRTAFRDNRGLELRRPFPPLARAREYLKPLRASAHRIITQDYHSRSASPKPRRENRRYASDAQGGAGTALTLKGKYGGMEVSDARRLRQLEDENGKLKRLLADSMLDNVILKDLLGKVGRRQTSGVTLCCGCCGITRSRSAGPAY